MSCPPLSLQDIIHIHSEVLFLLYEHWFWVEMDPGDAGKPEPKMLLREAQALTRPFLLNEGVVVLSGTVGVQSLPTLPYLSDWLFV